LRDELESDGFAIPSNIDFPGRHVGPKVVSNLWFKLVPGHEHEVNMSKLWNGVLEFFNRAHMEGKHLVLSAEAFNSNRLRFPIFNSLLAPWDTHVVVVYRPFYDWVVSWHSQIVVDGWMHQSLTEWLTLDRMYGFVSGAEDVLFSVPLANLFRANGFSVTVLALDESLLLTFFCNVVHAHLACQELREHPPVAEKENARKSDSCNATHCLSSDKLAPLLDLSVQLDGAVPMDVQRSEAFLRDDFATKARSKYFCSCKR